MPGLSSSSADLLEECVATHEVLHSYTALRPLVAVVRWSARAHVINHEDREGEVMVPG